MSAPLAKARRSDAERAAEWTLRVNCACLVTRRALRTKFAKVDFYSSDVIGKRRDGSCVYAQATAGGSECARTRRRKLEAVPWHPSERVLLLQLVERPPLPGERGKAWAFMVHEYYADDLALPYDRTWHNSCAVWPVPRE